MSPKKLDSTIYHARTCEPDTRKHLHFSLTSEQNAGVLSKNVEEEMDSISTAKHDASKLVSDIHKADLIF